MECVAGLFSVDVCALKVGKPMHDQCNTSCRLMDICLLDTVDYKADHQTDSFSRLAYSFQIFDKKRVAHDTYIRW